VDTARQKYIIQPKPYLGGNFGDLSDATYRVLDGYTGVPVGAVWNVLPKSGGFDYRASCFFSDGDLSPRGGGNIRPPSGGFGWGKRYDLAAKEVWEAYNRTLPLRDRVERCVWRWFDVAWFVVGTVVGAVAGTLASFVLPRLFP